MAVSMRCKYWLFSSSWRWRYDRFFYSSACRLSVPHPEMTAMVSWALNITQLTQPWTIVNKRGHGGSRDRKRVCFLFYRNRLHSLPLALVLPLAESPIVTPCFPFAHHRKCVKGHSVLFSFFLLLYVCLEFEIKKLKTEEEKRKTKQWQTIYSIIGTYVIDLFSSVSMMIQPKPANLGFELGWLGYSPRECS